jgi:hypothetical protein
LSGKRPSTAVIIAILLFSQLACSTVAPSSLCTLGVQGSQTTVTYDGPGAQQACDQIRQSSQFNQQFVATQQEPTSVPVVCDVARGPIHIRVRDNGNLKSVANQLCQSLQQGLSF